MEKTKKNESKAKDKKETEPKEKQEAKETEEKDEENKPLILKTEENQIKNKAKNSGRKNISFISQKVQVPISVKERIDFIKDIFNNDEIVDVNLNAPLARSADCQEMGRFFNSRMKTIPTIAGGVLYFLSTNMSFTPSVFSADKRSPITKNVNPNDVLQKGIINSFDEFLILYKEIFNFAGVKSEIVPGYLKRKGYKVGDSLSRHKWIALICPESKMLLIDPLLCVGSVNEVGEYVPDFKPYYFLTLPEFFVQNHLPEEEKYQMIRKTMNVKEFTRRPLVSFEDFYQNVFKFNINLQNFFTPEIKCTTNETTLKFQMEAILLEMKCTLNGKLVDEEVARLTDNNLKNNYCIYFKFPQNGEYKCSIVGKTPKSPDDGLSIMNFVVDVKILKVINHSPSPKRKVNTHIRMASPQYYNPKKKIESTIEKKLQKSASDFDEKIKNKCYDNSNCYLFEPRNKVLKIGPETKFKVRVRNAKYVAVLDGKKWNYLKRKEVDIFEGSVAIKNENVVLCAMRNNNLYTEVYEFIALKK